MRLQCGKKPQSQTTGCAALYYALYYIVYCTVYNTVHFTVHYTVHYTVNYTVHESAALEHSQVTIHWVTQATFTAPSSQHPSPSTRPTCPLPSRLNPPPQVGCGVGNTTFPLLEVNPSAQVYACDYAPTAIRLVKENPAYAASGRVHAFVADITGAPG